MEWVPSPLLLPRYSNMHLSVAREHETGRDGLEGEGIEGRGCWIGNECDTVSLYLTSRPSRGQWGEGGRCVTGKLQCGAVRSRRARNHTSARDRDRLCAYLLHCTYACLVTNEPALHWCMAPPRVGGTVGGLEIVAIMGQKKLLHSIMNIQIA